MSAFGKPVIHAPQQLVARLYIHLCVMGVAVEGAYEEGDSIISDQVTVSPAADLTAAYELNPSWAICRYDGPDDKLPEDAALRAFAYTIGMVAVPSDSRRLWLIREDCLPHQIPRKPNINELLAPRIETWGARDALTYHTREETMNQPPRVNVAIRAEETAPTPPQLDDPDGLLS